MANSFVHPLHRSFTVTICVPASVTLSQDDVREGIAALLFHDGKVSHKEACELLGKERREFDEVLAAHGFSPSDEVEPSEENSTRLKPGSDDNWKAY